MPDEETVWQLIFALTYTPHGGSGLTWGHGDVMGLDWRQAVWFADRLNEQREAEAAELEKAYKSRG